MAFRSGTNTDLGDQTGRRSANSIQSSGLHCSAANETSLVKAMDEALRGMGRMLGIASSCGRYILPMGTSSPESAQRAQAQVQSL
jgi:hypothetical protein